MAGFIRGYRLKTIAFRREDIADKWYVVDAEGQILGRMAAKVAAILRGKHKSVFTPNQDVGDHVVVVNAEKVVLTGEKWKKKQYHHHTGFIGGLKSATAETLRREKPERVVEYAVLGMLPKTKLGKAMGQKLKVYVGADHPHQAQRPEPLVVGEG